MEAAFAAGAEGASGVSTVPGLSGETLRLRSGQALEHQCLWFGPSGVREDAGDGVFRVLTDVAEGEGCIRRQEWSLCTVGEGAAAAFF